MALDSKIPNGPIADKWTNYKDHINLVNPANKRNLDIIVVGTGLAGGSAAATLAEQGIHVNVVSMPCTNVFDAQDKAYQAAVLPKGLPRVAVEAGVTDFWRKYVGLDGAVVGIDHFGESAPAEILFKEFGFTTENVVAAVKSVL